MGTKGIFTHVINGHFWSTFHMKNSLCPTFPKRTWIIFKGFWNPIDDNRGSTILPGVYIFWVHGTCPDGNTSNEIKARLKLDLCTSNVSHCLT